MNLEDIQRLCPASGWRDFGALLRSLANLPFATQRDLVTVADAWLQESRDNIIRVYGDDPDGNLVYALQNYRRELHPESLEDIWPDFPQGPAPPALSLVRELEAAPPEAKALQALLHACPHLEAIEFFDALDAPALDVLATSPARQSIREFHIDQNMLVMNDEENPLPSQTVATLFDNFPALETLIIMGGLDDDALHALSNAPASLRFLILRDNKFTSAGIASLARVPFTALEELCLVPHLDFELDLDALRHLANAPHLHTLQILTGFYMAGASARAIIAASPHLSDMLQSDA